MKTTQPSDLKQYAEFFQKRIVVAQMPELEY